MTIPSLPVRQLMSLIGLFTVTEKQVYLGRLHMRSIQWHLKNNWRVPDSLEKVIPIPRSLHPHLKWWLEEDNVLIGQPLLINWEIHPLMSTKMRISLISWIVPTETDPRVRGIPSWNLSLVLHQLTKAPFEPLKDTSM